MLPLPTASLRWAHRHQEEQAGERPYCKERPEALETEAELKLETSCLRTKHLALSQAVHSAQGDHRAVIPTLWLQGCPKFTPLPWALI